MKNYIDLNDQRNEFKKQLILPVEKSPLVKEFGISFINRGIVKYDGFKPKIVPSIFTLIMEDGNTINDGEFNFSLISAKDRHFTYSIDSDKLENGYTLTAYFDDVMDIYITVDSPVTYKRIVGIEAGIKIEYVED